MFQLLVTGGLLGIVGQGVRVIVGLKKLREATYFNSTPNNNIGFNESFDLQKLLISLFIGFVAGILGALSIGISEFDRESAITIIGLGYLGVDFIEGVFLSKKFNFNRPEQLDELQTRPKIEALNLIDDTINNNFQNVNNKIDYLAMDRLNSGSSAFEQEIIFALNKKIYLSASVGQGCKNLPSDVLALRTRFRNLGYGWISSDVNMDDDLKKCINLFQSIISGRERVFGDAIVSVPGPNNGSYVWLKAENAPQWTRLEEGSKTDRTFGFINTTKDERDDFGTSWLVDTIREAGKIYYETYLIHNANASLIAVNDLSESKGGDVLDHAGHETGMSVDIRLPKLNGSYGGITYKSDDYDRNAIRAIIQSFKMTTIGVRNIYFNDPSLINEGLCKFQERHHDHVHVQIRVPSIKTFAV